MFKVTGDSFYLETLCPEKEIIFERVIFGISAF